MIEKVRLMEQRYNELSNKLSEPGIADDQKLFTDLMKEFKNLTPVVEKYREYEKAANSFNEAKDFLEAAEWTRILRKWFNLNLMSLKKIWKNFLMNLLYFFCQKVLM